ncbi:MAG: tRNA (N(6)-L-threonylcarbamoyladenosine(37)-C(2))-methylthiotransferase MtaB [Erysipelotrichaceae bacterium]|nr:tRNA (N(6)-L-threonylcarbamoyladenosine(37)-C(2))-methylthiotransferase MtaB [Erysipelotrichaceae bacterium]
MKFSICNLGCKVNNYEANWYAQQLSEKYQEVPFGNEPADIFIINSCTVTNTAGSKTRQMMHKARKLNEKAVICVVGCYVQMEYDKKEIFEDCDILIGSNHKKELPELIDRYIETRERIIMVDDLKQCPYEEMALRQFNQTRAYLKIQDGCNQFCSYCVIPYARGRERCLKADKAVEIASELVRSGHSELVLTGIHTGRYHDGETDLTALIKRLLREVDGLKRLRISSIEVTEITDELIDLMASEERVARHLHIPLQSGCNRILKDMHRPYTTAQFLDCLNKVRSKVGTVSISTDVIVGFPGESEENFRETYEFIRQSGMSFLHVFPYAAKDHTVAAGMKNQINGTVKKQRVAELTKLSSELYNEFVKGFVGKTGTVLFERGTEGLYTGHNSEYIEVKVTSDKDLSHQFFTVEFDSWDGEYLIGHVIEG